MPEGVDVVVEADRGDGGPAQLLAVTAGTAAAALDPHDVSEEVLSVGAVEAEPDQAGGGGCAAAAIRAGPTGTRAVTLSCRAPGEGDSDRLHGADSSLTLFPLLVWQRKLQLTLSDLTQSGFSDQLALWVVVGHSAGDPHPTCAGARGPLCGLRETAGLQKDLSHGV